MSATLAIRVDPTNPDHHLWRNGRVWWLHYTLDLGDGRTRRVRLSLETRDVEEARRRRDRIFELISRRARALGGAA